MRYKDLNLKRSPYKVWYTGSNMDWTLDQVVCADDPNQALNVIKGSYPWAVIVDWALIDNHDEPKQATHTSHIDDEKHEQS